MVSKGCRLAIASAILAGCAGIDSPVIHPDTVPEARLAPLRPFSRAALVQPPVSTVARGAPAFAGTAAHPVRLLEGDPPRPPNEIVAGWVERYRTRNRAQFALHLRRLGRFDAFIRGELHRRGMPEEILFIPAIESRFEADVRRPGGVAGLWQLHTTTARHLGLEVSDHVDERLDPVASTFAALDYLQQMHDLFDSWLLAFAAYNAGAGRIRGLLRRQAGGATGADSLYWAIYHALPPATRMSIPATLAAAVVSADRERYGFADVVPDAPLAYDEVDAPGGLRLEAIARAADLPAEELLRLNRHLIRAATPPGRRFRVRVPPGTRERAAQAIARLGTDGERALTAGN